MKKHIWIVGTLWVIAGIVQGLEPLPSYLVSKDVITNWNDLPFGLEKLVSLDRRPGDLVWEMVRGVLISISGVGLFLFQKWARVTTVLLAIASAVLAFPIGTALGAYSIWVLFHVHVEAMFQTKIYRSQPLPEEITSLPGWDILQHVKLVAWAHMLFGATATVMGSVFFFGGIAHGMRDMAPLAVMVGGGWLITSLPALIAGYHLLQYKQWARVIICIVAVLKLLDVPGGTMLGVYSLWVLVRMGSHQLFGSSEPSQADNPIPAQQA